MRRMHITDHQSKQYIVGISSFERRVPMRCSKYLYVVVQPCPLKQMRGWGEASLPLLYAKLFFKYYVRFKTTNIYISLTKLFFFSYLKGQEGAWTLADVVSAQSIFFYSYPSGPQKN